MTQTQAHRYAAASPLSLSLESFPSLSSLSRRNDEDALSEEEEEDLPRSHRHTSSKPVVLAPLSSDEESAYYVQEEEEDDGSEEEHPTKKASRRDQREASLETEEDTLEERRGASWIDEEEEDDEAVEADDEEPELSFRRRSSRQKSSSPLNRRSSVKAVSGRRQSRQAPIENQDREANRGNETITVSKGETTTREGTLVTHLRQQHFVACFVRIDPPLLRSLKHLELSSLNLKRTDLRTLATNLFLLEALRWISLEDNQLDDSCIKEIRMILSVEGLLHANFSRNLLGRGAARMVADRLKHRLALRSLDITGNPWFFAFDDAADVARVLAQGLASNQTIVELRISLPVHYPHLERDRFVLPPPPPPQQAASRARKTHPPGNRNSVSGRDQAATPAEAFARELAQEFSQHPQSRALQSLGLVHAELSRTSVVNLMKIANKLLVLDLSFAFAGIPAAQVIAAALKMNDFATLTDLNLKGNRLKTMGTRAICRALHVNARITSLNVSRNDLRSDLLPDLAAMLEVNRTLVQLDLTQNQELFSGVDERSVPWKTLSKVMKSQGALRFFGDLDRIPASTSMRQALQKQLDENQQRSDDLVLLAVHQSMEFEAAIAERSTKSSKPPPSIGSLQTTTLSNHGSSSKTLWKLRTAIAKQSRVSVKWKLQAFNSTAARAKNTRPHSPHTVDTSGACVYWRVVVHRKCDLRGTVDLEAARDRFPIAPSSSVGFELCSALVHCEEGDLISLIVSLTNGAEDEDEDGSSGESIKVLGKEFTVLPHQLTLRHILHNVNYDIRAPPVESHGSSVLEWQQKLRREPARDPFTHTAELQCCYVPRTATYRVVWRVRLDSVPPAIVAKTSELNEFLQKQFYWQVLRSHCWDPQNVVAMQKGSLSDFEAVVRNESELMVSAEPVELVAGENVHVRVETFTPELSVQLLQFYVLIEATAWEHYGAIAA